jgi:hypothetical protein
LWSEHLRREDNLEKLGADGSIIVKYILKKWQGRRLFDLMWLRVGNRDGLLRTRKLNFVLGIFDLLRGVQV